MSTNSTAAIAGPQGSGKGGPGVGGVSDSASVARRCVSSVARAAQRVIRPTPLAFRDISCISIANSSHLRFPVPPRRLQSELMSLMEAELAAKRRLRSEIAEYKEILRQHAADKSRTQRQRSGAMNFDSLSYNRARGPSPSKLTGLFPHIENPSSYDLGLL